MLTANVENMFVTIIGRTLETSFITTQCTVIIWTVRRQSDSNSRKLVFNVGSTLVQLFISAWGFANYYFPGRNFTQINNDTHGLF